MVPAIQARRVCWRMPTAKGEKVYRVSHWPCSKTVRALSLGVLILLTAGASGAAAAGSDIVLHARSVSTIHGSWSLVSDSTAADGVRLANPDAGAAKVATPSGTPQSYFEIPFSAQPGTAYHLWIRAKAQNNSYTNDSVYVQFSGSVTSSGAANFRIGSGSAMMYSLEEDNGVGDSGWGWQDNGFGVGVLGENVFFQGDNQVIRVQAREDGISIDQIVLSPVTYISKAPGAGKNDTTILAENALATPTSASPSPSSASPSGFAWTSLVKATASGGRLVKTGTCGDCGDAGGASQQQVGAVSFTVTPGQKSVVGLGRDTSTNMSYTRINYGLNFPGGSVFEVREAGTYRTEGTFGASDVFKIAVEGTTVRYYKNSTVVYTSKTAATTALVVDATLVSTGAAVQVTASSAPGTPAPTPAPTPTPTPTPAPTGSTLRVLQWNTHHGGYGTDNVYSPNRLATWAASFKPDVVMFNEIEKNDSWGNQDQPEVYKALLQQKTGKTWYYVFAQEFGQWSANGKGNLILSTYPISVSDRYELVHNADRSIAMASITVNSRPITLILTHLDPYDQSLRLTQATEVTSWASAQPENRIMTGDMNAWPDQTSIAYFNRNYNDSWTVAASKGTATAFAGNSGETKNGRIDYIFYSKASTNLTVVSSQVFDTRDANGVTPSDHRPVLTTFTVK